jgi:small subunit ribosomal protein S16
LAVRLRLRRMGKKKQPIYKLVAADSRSPRDGKFLEDIGLYNPLTKPHTIEIKEDRALYWLDKGAQPSDTVKSLLKQKGNTLKRELQRKGLPEDKIREELDNWAKMREARLVSKLSKKKSKKSKSQEKSEEGEQQSEVVSEEKAAKEENIEKSAAEVKGAASEGNTENN